MSGFFFCVRATRITVDDCHFAGNATGVSIGTRDCYNSVRRCISSSWALGCGPSLPLSDGPLASC